MINTPIAILRPAFVGFKGIDVLEQFTLDLIVPVYQLRSRSCDFCIHALYVVRVYPQRYM